MKRKPWWLYRQSGVIPYLRSSDSIRIVLVSSNSKTGWVFPKGVVEKELSPAHSAQKEAEEEAGVTGTLDAKEVDTYTYDKWGGTCRVTVYAMQVNEVMDEWPEQHKRDRIIVSIDQALKKIKRSQKGSLMKLRDVLLP